MKLFLAVDGGQTTTKVVLADEDGRILSQATAGPCNHTEEPGGRERFEEVIRTAVTRSLSAAQGSPIESQEFRAACFGMTGETEIKQKILERIIKTRHMSVVHDSVNALMGATAGEPGVIVIAGTGSVARGMDPRGKDMRVGGWGHLFGDEGSAYWIGREAVRAVAAESDGFGDKTALTSLLLQRLGVDSSWELMAKYYAGEWSRDHLAGLSVWVNEVAEHGDKIAQAILKNAGGLLARYARAILAVLFPSSGARGGKQKAPLVSYTGGVFASPHVLTPFRDAILAESPHVEIHPPQLSPVFGSLLLAYRSVGLALTKEIRGRWSNISNT